MASDLDRQAQLDALWREVHRSVSDSAWESAEGLLRRFLQLAPQSPLEVWDSLAYVLLMQGENERCLEILNPWAEAPERSFWVQHKLGDARRGLHQLESAALHYRQSLADGSDAPITTRNLLQALDGLDPARAVREVQRWQAAEVPPAPAAWEGARQAALLVPGLELARQLALAGEADEHCRKRLLEQACYALDLGQIASLLSEAAVSSAGLSPWEQALRDRLQQLRLLPTTATAPASGAPRH